MEDAYKYHAKALEELRADHKMEELRTKLQLEQEANNRTRELLGAHAEPVEEDRYKEPFVYYEPSEGTGGVPAAICTCGWRKPHYRFKVLQKAAIRHSEKTGHKIS